MSAYPARCPARNLNGRMCDKPAGQCTNHLGYGTCVWHRGAHRNVEEAWAMAQEIAAEREITPHEALLGLVRTAAARAAWTDNIIFQQLRDHADAGGDPLKPPDALVPWLRQSREERRLAATTAKTAVDAGVMAALERRIDLDRDLVVSALAAAMDAAPELPQETRIAMLGAAQQHLLGAGEIAA